MHKKQANIVNMMKPIYCQHRHKKLLLINHFNQLSIKCNRCKHINHYQSANFECQEHLTRAPRVPSSQGKYDTFTKQFTSSKTL